MSAPLPMALHRACEILSLCSRCLDCSWEVCTVLIARAERSASPPQGDPFDWWVTFMYFVGDCLWFVATSFQIIEALNTGWDTRYFEWQRDGCKGPPPR